MKDVIYLALAAALWWTCFCRATRMNKRNTLRPVRWAFALLTAAATVAIYAPLATAYQPDWVTVLLLAGIAAVQITTSKYWRHGVPDNFRIHAAPSTPAPTPKGPPPCA